MENTKAVIYARVSSKEQEETGYSLPAQEKLLRDYAERYDLTISKVFSVAESASGSKQREVFAKMMDYMEKEKIPNLLCEKVDRLTRNLKEAVVANEWVEEDEQRRIHFVKQNLVIHKFAKSDEKFRWDIEIVLAKKYIANLSEEVRKGQEQKISEGWLPTKPPLGYRTVGDKGKKVHVQDPEVAPLVRRMFELYATGDYSLDRLEVELMGIGLRNRAGKRLLGNRIHVLLSDPFYYGKLRWKGVVYEGAHEPLISKELFDKVQSVMRRKSHPTFSKHLPLFKAKMRCVGCGGLATWEMQKGHWYGHCNNHGKSKNCPKKTYVREEDVEAQLMHLMGQIAPRSHGMLEWIKEAIRADYEADTRSRESEMNRLRALQSNVRQQKDRYYEAKISGTAPAEFCDRKLKELTEQEEAYALSLSRVSTQSDSYKELRYAVHELAYHAREIYEQADVADKRLLLSLIFTNLEQDGLVISPKFTLAAEYLANWMPKLYMDYELQNMLENKGENTLSGASSPVLLRG